MGWENTKTNGIFKSFQTPLDNSKIDSGWGKNKACFLCSWKKRTLWRHRIFTRQQPNCATVFALWLSRKNVSDCVDWLGKALFTSLETSASDPITRLWRCALFTSRDIPLFYLAQGIIWMQKACREEQRSLHEAWACDIRQAIPFFPRMTVLDLRHWGWWEKGRHIINQSKVGPC